MIKNIEEASISLCDNGFLLQFSYTDEVERYQNKRMIFATKQELYDYLDLIIEARNKHGNPSL